MGSAAFLPQQPQALGTHRGSATSLFTMSDDAAATAPAAQLELHHSLVDKTSCQPYAQQGPC